VESERCSWYHLADSHDKVSVTVDAERNGVVADIIGTAMILCVSCSFGYKKVSIDSN